LDKPRRGQNDPTVGEEGGKIEHGGSRIKQNIENHGHIL
jgi:hypothetical protein